MMIFVCVGQKKQWSMCILSVNAYAMVRRRWLRTCDVLEEKERTMDVIKGYVEVNDNVENETMEIFGRSMNRKTKEWKESCKCGFHKSEENKCVLSQKDYNIWIWIWTSLP